jgi:hypothetical protein
MTGSNRDIGVGIAMLYDGKFMEKLRQPLNNRRVTKLAVHIDYCFFFTAISRLARPHPGRVLVAISNQQVCSH